MPQETDRLKLPLPLGNENVTRESINGIFEKIDAGVATQADLDTLREAVSKMDIPDASLTQKGKVQLTNGTTSTSQTLAATGKAVNDARQSAITEAASNTEIKVVQGYNDAKYYVDSNFRKPSQLVNANLVKNSTGQMGLTYWTNYGAIPILSYDSNPTVGSFFGVVNALSTQQYAILDSENIGVSPGGTYLLQGMFHSTGVVSGSSMFIEVKDGNTAVDVTIAYLSADYEKWWHRKSMFITIPAGVTSVRLRLAVSNTNSGTKGFARISLTETTLDVPYSMDRDIRALYEQNEAVKQSGVDAKNRIVGAINAMGGNASTSDSWVQLTGKINDIQIGKPQKLTPNIDFSQEFTDSTRLFYLDIATFAAGTRLIQLNRIGAGDSSVVLGSGGTSGTASTVVLVDSNNVEWAVSSTHLIYMRTFLHITIDLERGIANFLDTPATGDVIYNMPTGFKTNGLLKLKYKFTKGNGFATFYGRYKSGAMIISL